MKVLNIHTRTINQPIEVVGGLLSSLSSERDKVWPFEAWPAMKFKEGLTLNARGGHGPIRYHISKYTPNKSIEFTILSPKGFHGTHSYAFMSKTDKTTEVTHTIDMKTEGSGTIIWLFAVKWLHNALLEDSLDKIENQFNKQKKNTKRSFYVSLLRRLVKQR